MKRLSIIALALIVVGCEMSKGNLDNPLAPSNMDKSFDASPADHSGGAFEAADLGTVGPSTGPNGSQFQWDPASAQYTFRLDVTATSSDVSGVIVPFITDYAQGHPDFLKHQKPHLPGLQDVFVARGTTKLDQQPYDLPDGAFCLQVDFYQGVTKAQFKANPAKYHPSVYGATTWKIGKTKTVSGSCKPTTPPVTPPTPPVIPPVVNPPVQPPVVEPPVVEPPVVIPPVVTPPVVEPEPPCNTCPPPPPPPAPRPYTPYVPKPKPYVKVPKEPFCHLPVGQVWPKTLYVTAAEKAQHLAEHADDYRGRCKPVCIIKLCTIPSHQHAIQ